MIKFLASIVTGFIFIVIFSSLLYGRVKDNLKDVVEEPVVLGKPTQRFDINTYDLNFSDKDYRIHIISTKNSDVRLKSNLPIFRTSNEILSDNCTGLVNAGFYTKENLPVGLFVENGIKLKDWKESLLFDGILSVNTLNVARITEEVPKDDLTDAVQSGPLLISNSFNHELSIINDKPARRMVAIIDGDNTLYFFTIYNPNSVFDGPYLADMPEILRIIEGMSDIKFADAINLDGGSASAFMFDSVRLPELSPIGSYYCIN